MLKKIFAILASLFFFNPSDAQIKKSTETSAQYYAEPAWQPRALLPYRDAIHNDFWPPSPEVKIDYNDVLFDESKLSKVPAPGIHPRVLITPEDVENIRKKLAAGEQANPAFKTMWKRVSRLKSPFYALVTNDDTLGRKLAEELIDKMHRLAPKIDAMNQQADRENIWSAERSVVAMSDPDPPTEIWDLLDYDYLHKWMTDAERKMANELIAKIIKNRISNFLMVPDHFMINNHEGFGMEYIRLMLLIEGEAGFDEQLFNLAKHKTNAMLTWFLSKDGMCYESIKGWLNTSAIMAVALRDRKLLKHSHLRAKMNFFLSAIRWEDCEWHIRDEMRASAFHVIWMMHYFHPADKSIDFLYSSTFSTHDFLTNANAKWPDPVGVCYELLLLFAEDALKDEKGTAIDWKLQSNIDKLRLPLNWHDSTRGYIEVRNSWKKEDLKLGFVCKQDFYYGGHEGSENNRITLWKDGVNWVQDNNMLATKATFLQNMITIDGKGLHWPPAPGNWLGMVQSKDAITACGDGKIGYGYTKIMQVHPLYFPSLKIPYYSAFAEGNFDLSRDIQVAFQPSTIAWNNGYAHTDYGPWSGETRLVEGYKPFNEVRKAFRTVHMAKGKYPYVLIIDDIQKDDQPHLYSWNISVPRDAELISVKTPEIVFQATEPAADNMDEFILSSRRIEKDSTGKPLLRKGEPLCLIRVLNRNSQYGFPVPSLNSFEGYQLLQIPAHAVQPDFKVLIYPFKWGEPLPTVQWSNEQLLSVKISNQHDTYTFDYGEAGRTALMKRNELFVTANQVSPAVPVLLVGKQKYDKTDYRYTQKENTIPVYQFYQTQQVLFQYPTSAAEIRYTLDGSDPTIHSARYTNPFTINKSCTLKARTFHAEWQFGQKDSKTVTALFVQQQPAKAISNLPATSKSGLSLLVYEINTKLYNDKGFFDADRIMLPDVSKYQPVHSLHVNSFELPYLSPVAPLEQQVKAFYQFRGNFYAKATGKYQFTINSCGPIRFTVSSREVIVHKGVFHQQQQTFSGEVILAKGWHVIDLVVCDPLFWNANSLDKMPFDVSYNINNGNEEKIASNLLTANDSYPNVEAVKQLNVVEGLPQMEKGFDLYVYDRTGERRSRNFMDVENIQPFKHERVNELTASNSRNSVKVFNGYYYAAQSGVYQFHLPFRQGANTILGSTQASCQSLLKIDDNYVLQRGVYGRNLSGKVYLNRGWHAFSLRLGTGAGWCKVTLPDKQTVELNGYNIFRPVLLRTIINNEVCTQQFYEFYDTATLKFTYADSNAVIRYTTDGTEPTLHAAAYTQPISISENKMIKAAAFINGKAVTGVTTLACNKVVRPSKYSLGIIRFHQWNGQNSYYQSSGSYKVWIARQSVLADGINGKALSIANGELLQPRNVDVNVSRDKISSGFKVYHLNMKENALTVSLWFKTNELRGRLFDKQGYNAFGKRYRTVSCTVENGRIFGNGNKISGGKLALNQWQHLVFSVSETESAIYLNGVQVAKGLGTKDIATDALDFFTNMQAVVDEVELFDACLSDKEIIRLFESKKPERKE